MFKALKEKRDNGETVYHPLSMIREGKNDGYAVEKLRLAVEEATKALNAKRDSMQVDDYDNLVEMLKNDTASIAKSEGRLDKLRQQRVELDKKIESEELCLNNLRAAEGERKRSIRDMNLSKEDLSKITEAEEAVKRAKKDHDDGLKRNQSKNVRARCDKAIKGIDASKGFNFTTMVPIIVHALVDWYKEMRYTIDVEVKMDMTKDGRYARGDAMNRFENLVAEIGSRGFLLCFLISKY